MSATGTLIDHLQAHASHGHIEQDLVDETWRLLMILSGRLDQIQMVMAGANRDEFKMGLATKLARSGLLEVGEIPTGEEEAPR